MEQDGAAYERVIKLRGEDPTEVDGGYCHVLLDGRIVLDESATTLDIPITSKARVISVSLSFKNRVLVFGYKQAGNLWLKLY